MSKLFLFSLATAHALTAPLATRGACRSPLPVAPRLSSPRMEGFGDFFGQVAKNMKQMTDQRVGRASHIMLRPSESAVETLNAWKAEIANDDEKFQSRARESSQCRSAPRGGDLGFVTRGKLSSEFDEVIFELEPGFVYGPLQTQFGHHLIYLHSCRAPNDKKPSVASLA